LLQWKLFQVQCADCRGFAHNREGLWSPKIVDSTHKLHKSYRPLFIRWRSSHVVNFTELIQIRFAWEERCLKDLNLSNGSINEPEVATPQWCNQSTTYPHQLHKLERRTIIPGNGTNASQLDECTDDLVSRKIAL
jgi:hypothetical protein